MFMYKMSKIVVTLIVAIAVCFLFSAVAFSIPVTNIYNRHNMSSGADSTHPRAKAPSLGGTDRICVFCHTPHSATPESTLWSRPDPETATFDLYAGRLAIKENPSVSQYNSPSVEYPNGSSRMCMSCHDGATAIGTVLGQPAEIEMEQRFVTGSAVVDLSMSHPISFVWDANVESVVNGWHVAEGTGSIYSVPSDYNIAYLDGNNRMQCTTCHDPHEDPSRDSGGNLRVAPNDFPPFWRHTVDCSGGVSSQNCYEDVCNECHSGTAPDITVPTDPMHNTTILVPY